MALEYYLLTCLGRDGLVITAATSDVITLNNHGMRAGHPVRFTTTGTLPGGLSANTTYYVFAADLLIGSFKVSATNDGDMVDITSTGSGVHKCVGSYWATLPAADPGGGGNYRSRYGEAGSERVFANIYDLRIYLYDNRDYAKNVCVEIQGAWTDVSAHYLASREGWVWDGYFSLEVTTKINGVRDPDSFHFGVPGGGWAWISPANYFLGFSSSASRVTIDGVEAGNTFSNVSAAAFSMTGSLDRVVNCIANGSPTGTAFRDGGNGNVFVNNIAVGWPTGFETTNANGNGSVIAHCLAAGCGTGFLTEATTALSDYINNIALDNTTNWGTKGGGFCAGNAGATGDVVWASTGQPSITGLTTAIFNNSAASDFSLASSDSVLVDAGNDYFGMLPGYAIDDAVRPNYEAATYPNNYRDVGPFEYDHGNGLAPLQVELAFSGMAEGSVLAVYKTSDGTDIISPTTIGASGSHSTTYSYTGNVQIEVVVRKGTTTPYYLPYSAPGLITSTGFSLIVNQVPDGILNG